MPEMFIIIVILSIFAVLKYLITQKTIIMNKEVKKSQIQANRQFASILNMYLDSHKVSSECMNCPTDNPLFQTTCDYVDLRHQLFNLSRLLNQLADYEEKLL